MPGATEPRISVVVASHDRADRLPALLAALAAQSVADPFEVVVVDDCSNDATPEVLARAAKRGDLSLRIVRLATNGGPAIAREVGWRTARGRLVAFTDDDCRPDRNWLQAGLRSLEQHPGAIIQGRTEPDPDHRHRAGPFSRWIEVTERDPAFQTCNVFYPRELLERIDGFDTEAFGTDPGGEDSDLAWRAIAAGARTAFATDAVVYHEVANLGPAGKLRVAARWTNPLRAYARHPELRRAHFTYGIFWKPTHYWLVRALLAILPVAGLRHLRYTLAFPYLRSVWARGKLEGGGPALAPFFVLYDLIELVTVLRAAIRYRHPMI